MSFPQASKRVIEVHEQITDLMLREQKAKTEKAEYEAERARIELEAVRAFVRANPTSAVVAS